MNLWSFFLQTLSVSLVAGLLLFVKWLLADKLSPRWQYAVWSLLALRILLPTRLAEGLPFRLSLWLETAKAGVERSLDSAYASAYAPISVGWPTFTAPQSVTDWLFVLYAAGVVVMLLWYLISYLRLRGLLRRGMQVSEETRRQVKTVCQAYELRSCKMVAIPGLPTAFVCGVLRPLLALPAGTQLDDKVILHELLHLKYKDSLQSVLWCILRALHWCNPFLQYVFLRIGNDMEALCDQRVLERLEGEARREYGVILLSMANERYPRAAGTSSLSNGGKNIARRIAAIAHFKRYPRGMALVSVCIAFVLAVPTVRGYAATYDYVDYNPYDDNEWVYDEAMALSRLRRCTTIAGALDTYAKGLMLDNAVYIATAAPLERQEELAEQLRQHVSERAELAYLDQSAGYQILSLRKQSEDSYTAFLLFSVTGFWDEETFWDEVADWGEMNENGEPYANSSVLIPVTVTREDAWVVRESGERQCFPGLPADQFIYEERKTPAAVHYQASGESGTASVWVQTRHTIAMDAQDATWYSYGFGVVPFDDRIKPDAVFDAGYIDETIEYRCTADEAQREGLYLVAMEIVQVYAAGEEVFFPGTNGSPGVSYSSNDGVSRESRPVDEEWDGVLISQHGGSRTLEGQQVALPVSYGIRIFWNGEAVEDLMAEVVEK